MTKPKYTAAQNAAMDNLRARMAARRANKPTTQKLGQQPDGSFRGLVWRADGTQVLVVVPA